MGSSIVIFVLSVSGLALCVVLFMSIRGLRAYAAARGKRLVNCPETHCTAAVEVDALAAGMNSLHRRAGSRLQSCSRWPERQDCAQDCIQEIASRGAGCLVRSIVADWYRGKQCVVCHKPVDSVNEWAAHVPALLTPDAKTVSWAEVPAPDLPAVFSTHQPVCWSCHIAEKFRREHPELVTDRPARW